MKEFEPRPYQKEFLDNYRHDQPVQLITRRGRNVYYGVDMAKAGADKNVMAVAKRGNNGKIKVFYDEYSDWPNYKWYRHPFKWWQWRRLMKSLARKVKKAGG
jgi:hypothetical protein